MEYRVRKRNIEQVDYEVACLDAILSDAVLRRFHLRAGFTTTSPRALTHTRNYYGDFLRKLLDATLVFMQHYNRRSIRLTDVLRACSHYGIRLYGYDDMCVLEGPWGIEEYHVTEMVEANTTFSRTASMEEEPDQEPSGYYKKIDFVQNQKAWDAEEEEEDWGSDDSEWSWYSESDGESESEDEAEDMDEVVSPPRAANRWLKGEDTKGIFLESLRAAQDLVDEHLLVREPEFEIMECDEPMGQGYESDCDGSREPGCVREWKYGAEREEAKWSTLGNVDEFEAENTDTNEDFDDDIAEAMREYVIPRQIFMQAFYAQLCEAFGCSIPISAVALSALHNVSEQCLHAALTTGALQAQIVSTLMEDRLEATLSMQVEMEQERQKATLAEAAMLELQASYKVKELEMQRRITELERLLRIRQEAPVADIEMEPPKKLSPGKRKATSGTDPSGSKTKTTTSSSIVGSLRSRLTEYSLRKKAKINPI